MPFAGFGDAVTVRPSLLPVDLGPGPFSTAGARLLGVPPERLRRSDLVHPTRGAHMLVEPEMLVERALAFQVAMPGDRAFSHVAAALTAGFGGFGGEGCAPVGFCAWVCSTVTAARARLPSSSPACAPPVCSSGAR